MLGALVALWILRKGAEGKSEKTSGDKISPFHKGFFGPDVYTGRIV